MLEYARKVGEQKLRKMTFHKRGRMLKALPLHLLSKRDNFFKISWATGSTKADSWVDIEERIGNLSPCWCCAKQVKWRHQQEN